MSRTLKEKLIKDAEAGKLNILYALGLELDEGLVILDIDYDEKYVFGYSFFKGLKVHKKYFLVKLASYSDGYGFIYDGIRQKLNVFQKVS